MHEQVLYYASQQIINISTNVQNNMNNFNGQLINLNGCALNKHKLESRLWSTMQFSVAHPPHKKI